MKTLDGMLILLIISTIFTSAAAVAEKKKMGQYPVYWINALRVLHYFAFFISISYAFLFHGNVNLDFFYLTFMMWLFGHWTYLKNECVLGYIENKHYISGYEMGDNPGNNMYIRLLFGEWARPFVLAFGFVTLTSVFLVLHRVPLSFVEKLLIAFVMIAFTFFGFNKNVH